MALNTIAAAASSRDTSCTGLQIRLTIFSAKFNINRFHWALGLLMIVHNVYLVGTKIKIHNFLRRQWRRFLSNSYFGAHDVRRQTFSWLKCFLHLKNFHLIILKENKVLMFVYYPSCTLSCKQIANAMREKAKAILRPMKGRQVISKILSDSIVRFTESLNLICLST